MLQQTICLLLLSSIPMDLAPKDVQDLTGAIWVQQNLEESLKCLLLATVIQWDVSPANYFQQLIHLLQSDFHWLFIVAIENY